jgi:hypothetical protein
MPFPDTKMFLIQKSSTVSQHSAEEAALTELISVVEVRPAKEDGKKPGIRYLEIIFGGSITTTASAGCAANVSNIGA